MGKKSRFIKVWTVLFAAFTVSFACRSAEKSAKQQMNSIANWEKIAYDTSTTVSTANTFLSIAPRPITLTESERSIGGVHDFFSEGDYWWPDPDNPEGPYIRRDGQSNPANFNDHRLAMRSLNEWVSTLTAAYLMTGDEKYARHAVQHLRVFFLDEATKMNPHLLYAQAIQGRHTGRGIGIIDTIHLIEVTKSIQRLIEAGQLPVEQATGLKDWFDQYASWMNTHPYGLDEKDHGNNHSTWWAAQLAAFADLAERPDLTEVARQQFKKLLAAQMAEDGSFPDEIERTKAYNYTLFNLEGYSVLAELASSEEDNLWNYQVPNGNLKTAWQFIVPFLKDKESWMRPPDVEHFDELPIQTVGMLFAARQYSDIPLMDIWKTLSPTKPSEEMRRTFPLWEPILWKS